MIRIAAHTWSGVSDCNFDVSPLLIRQEVRTPKHGGSSSGGSVGDAAYAAKIAAQLDVNAAVKAILRGAASSPAHDHFLASYEAGLRVSPDAFTRPYAYASKLCSLKSVFA